ncbi:MAG: TetR family transcriptional regulator [Methylothermaceae bacteria B42]|nr:MAG: TetR family transcriptional regulator [Methylothermaceae bacteria B42]HHJ39282.1 TetR family transcriptional regulator [Methylothermaceae bacterium]
MSRLLNKQLKRDKILDQGVQLLMERGYHGTGIKDILASVDIPKGSFYYYFPSKEAFGAEVIHHYIEPFIQQLDEFLTQPDLDPVTALRRYFEALIEELIENDFKGGCLLGNLMGEIGDTSDTCRKALQEAVRKYRNKISQGLAQAQQRQLIRTDRSAESLADFMVDYWQGALLRMKIERSPAPLHAFMTQVFEETLPP